MWYEDPAFYITSVISIVGVVFSCLAFLEAKRAKTAATEAGTTVKIQTITIELTELSQRIDRIETDIDYSTARDLLNELTRRLVRLISPFEASEAYSQTAANLRETLSRAKDALNSVAPRDPSKYDNDVSVYFAIEPHFAEISIRVAELMGLFEKRNIEVGS